MKKKKNKLSPRKKTVCRGRRDCRGWGRKGRPWLLAGPLDFGGLAGTGGRDKANVLVPSPPQDLSEQPLSGLKREENCPPKKTSAPRGRPRPLREDPRREPGGSAPPFGRAGIENSRASPRRVLFSVPEPPPLILSPLSPSQNLPERGEGRQGRSGSARLSSGHRSQRRNSS